MERTNVSLAAVLLSSLMFFSTGYAKDFIDQTIDDVVVGAQAGGSIALISSAWTLLADNIIYKGLFQASPDAKFVTSNEVFMPVVVGSFVACSDNLNAIKQANWSSKSIQLVSAVAAYCATMGIQAKIVDLMS